MAPDRIPRATVVVCTYQRPEALDACLASLAHQTVSAYHLLIRDEPGPLAVIRNRGLRDARAPVVCFIDDDTVLPPQWLAGLLNTFDHRPNIVGVTGPAVIPRAYQVGRTLLRHPALLWAYQYVFCDWRDNHLERAAVPGRIYTSGAVSYTYTPTTYEGPVAFLEACNMAFRTEALRRVGGFDEGFQALGEWCEPDVGCRLRAQYGEDCLWFTPHAALAHHPAVGAATNRRRDTRTRLANYRRYHARWVRPTPCAWLHERFMTLYFSTWGRWA